MTLVVSRKGKSDFVLYYEFLQSAGFWPITEKNFKPFLNVSDARSAFEAWAKPRKLTLDYDPQDFEREIAAYFSNPDRTYSYFLDYQRSLPGGQVVFSSFPEVYELFKKWLINLEELHSDMIQELLKIMQIEPEEYENMKSAEKAEIDARLSTISRYLFGQLTQNYQKYANFSFADLKRAVKDSVFLGDITTIRELNQRALKNAEELTLDRFMRQYLPGYINGNGIFEIYTSVNLSQVFDADAALPVAHPITLQTIGQRFKNWIRESHPQSKLMDTAGIEQFLIEKYGQPLSKQKYEEVTQAKIESDLKRKFEQIEERRKLRTKQLETLEGIFKERKQLQIDRLKDLEKDVRAKYELEMDRFQKNLALMDEKDSIWLGLGVAETKSEVRYPGNVILSMILPATLNYNEYGIVIRDGVVISGIFTGEVVGTAKNSLVQSIFHNYGSERASDFITDLYFMSYAIYTPLNMTISLADLSDTDPNAVLAVEENKAKLMRRVQALAATYPTSGDPILQERHEREMLQLTRDFANIGAKVVDALATSNNISLIIKSKSKGKPAEFSRMMVDLQQMTINGQRLPTTLAGGTRRLPYYAKGEKSLESGGFINNSYIRGLEPDEYYQHAEGSRLGIVESQVKTPDVGDDHRKLVKTTEDLRTSQTNAVINQAVGTTISFAFGNHSLSPIHLRMTAMRQTNIASPFYPKEMLSRINSFYGRARKV
jgi:hypothetical protein